MDQGNHRPASVGTGPEKGEITFDSIRDYLISSNVLYDAEEWVSLSKKRESIAKMDDELNQRMKNNTRRLLGRYEREIDQYLQPKKPSVLVDNEESIREYVALSEALDKVGEGQSDLAIEENKRVESSSSNVVIASAPINAEIKLSSQQVEEANALARQHVEAIAANQARVLFAQREIAELHINRRFPNLNDTDGSIYQGPMASNELAPAAADRVESLLKWVADEQSVANHSKRIDSLKLAAKSLFDEQERVFALNESDVAQWKENNPDARISSGKNKDALNALSGIDMNSRSIASFLDDWLEQDKEDLTNGKDFPVLDQQIPMNDSQPTSSLDASEVNSAANNSTLEALEKLAREIASLKQLTANPPVATASAAEQKPQSFPGQPGQMYFGAPSDPMLAQQMYGNGYGAAPPQMQPQPQGPYPFHGPAPIPANPFNPFQPLGHPFYQPNPAFPGFPYPGAYPNPYMAPPPQVNPYLPYQPQPWLYQQQLQPQSLPMHAAPSYPEQYRQPMPPQQQRHETNGPAPGASRRRFLDRESAGDGEDLVGDSKIGSRPAEHRDRDARGPEQILSRQELRHQQELRRMQQELEKLKVLKELDDFKSDITKTKEEKIRSDAHAMWLAEQGQKLQQIKMEIALAKEKQTLSMHNEAIGINGNSGPSAAAGQGSSSTTTNVANSTDGSGILSRNNQIPNTVAGYSAAQLLIRQQCGVGTECVPLLGTTGNGNNGCNGAIVIVDGVAIALSQRQGTQFRVAMGTYDAQGRPLARLLSTEWCDWRRNTPFQFLPMQLRRPIKSNELLAPFGNDVVLYPKAVIEIQYRQVDPAIDSSSSAAKLLGWGTVALRSPTKLSKAMETSLASKVNPINAFLGDANNAFLLNGLWKVSLQRGMSDLMADPFDGMDDQLLLDSYMFCRVIDVSQKDSSIDWIPTFTDANTIYSTYLDQKESFIAKLLSQTSNAMSQSGSLQADDAVSKVAQSQSTERDPSKPLSKSPTPRIGTANSTASLNNFNNIRPQSSTPSVASNANNSIASAARPASNSSRPGSNSVRYDQSKGGFDIHPTIPEEPDGISPRAVSSSGKTKQDGQGQAGPTAAAGPAAAAAAGAGSGGNNVVVIAAPAALDDKSYWLAGAPIGPATDRYQRADGIDIYIDAARFLPNNVTVSRVIVKLLTSEKEVVGTPFVSSYLPGSASAMSPAFDFKVELRDATYNATATALIRVDTIDCSTLSACYVGYAAIKIFAQRDRGQPKFSQEPNIYINSGLFQLPLRAGRIPKLDQYDETLLDSLPRIPCASLLVRIRPAPKSGDGLTSLRMTDFPPEEWEKLGLKVSAPPYKSGLYNGLQCEPDENKQENISFAVKLQLSDENYDTILSQRLNDVNKLPVGFPSKPTSNSLSNAQYMQWISSLLPPIDRIKTTIDYRYCLPYCIDSGIAVSIDCLYSLPTVDATSFLSSTSSLGVVYKAIYSIVPPGLYYKDPPLNEQIKFTIQSNLDSSCKAPTFADGYSQFFPPKLLEQMYLVVDVRSVRVTKANTKKSSNTSAASASTTGRDSSVLEHELSIEMQHASKDKNSCYWTIVPLSKELITGKGFDYVNTDVFALPLVQGSMETARDVLTDPNPMKRLLTKLELPITNPNHCRLAESGAGAIVRIVNPLTRHLMKQELKEGILFPSASVSSSASSSAATAAVGSGTSSSSSASSGAGTAGGAGFNIARIASALPADAVNHMWVDKVIASAANGVRNLKADKYYFDPVKLTTGKSILQTLPPIASQDPKRVVKQINKEFSVSTGIPFV